MKIVHQQIKCCNIDMGVYLLDDIKDRLNNRHLNGSVAVINDIVSDDLTWITVTIEFSNDYSNTSIESEMTSHITGLISGILIWSGVEVI